MRHNRTGRSEPVTDVGGVLTGLSAAIGNFEPTQVFVAIRSWKNADCFVVPSRDPDNNPIPPEWAGRTGVVVNDRAEVVVMRRTLTAPECDYRRQQTGGHALSSCVEELTEYLFGVRFDDAPDATVTLSHRWMVHRDNTTDTQYAAVGAAR